MKASMRAEWARVTSLRALLWLIPFALVVAIGVARSRRGVFADVPFETVFGELLFYANQMAFWLYLGLAPLLIGMDLELRQVNVLIYAGHARSAIFLSRCVSYYVIAALLTVVLGVTASLVFARQFFALVLENPAYALGALLGTVVLSLSFAGLTFMLAHVCKGMLPLLSALGMVAMAQLFLVRQPETAAVLYALGAFPVAAVVEKGANAAVALKTTGAAMGYAALMTLVAWLRFRKADLA